MFKVGQWIYAIEVEEDYWDEAEVSGLLFMAECGNYIIAVVNMHIGKMILKIS